ncbi:MAG: redox-regulated ATPase YchF [Bacilli bacterium]
MSLKAGIVGLPNVGKSTLFNAVTKKHILAENYPFATIDPNVGVVSVPDKRLDILNNMYIPKKLISTQFEFIDIAGLVKGASKGEGLGNKFLSHVREVDAIIEVVRCFDNKDIIHVEGSVDPLRDVDIINIELILSDMEIVDNRISKIEKKAITTNDKDGLRELNILKKCQENLGKGIPLRSIGLEKEEIEVIKSYNFITLKPIIYLANVDQMDLVTKTNPYIEVLEKVALEENAPIIIMCTEIESELAELDDTEKNEFLNEIGIDESGLDKLIKTTYELLGLKTFFTVGSDEVKAWTFIDGMKAPDCAGIIHTDFKKGFIRAEVISYEDLISCGSELKVKEAGKARVEGKEYIMKDGDICHFRFNV